MKIPSQFYIFAMVLSLYYWPWHLSFFDPDTDALLTVISLQLLFVIACNYLTRASWATAIIIVEAFCMIVNLFAALNGATLFHYHADIMRAAFIIQMLIVTMSLGAVVGHYLIRLLRTHSDRIRDAGRSNNAAENCEAAAQ
jgi:hypothetical protein